MSKTNSSHHVVPEVAHLINSEQADTMVTEVGDASVTITTLDSLQSVVTPWRNEDEEDNSEEEEEEEEVTEEEVPGMSLETPAVEKVMIGSKERKAVNKAAMAQLHNSKAFKAKERMKAKKQRTASRWKKNKLSKKAKHTKKMGGGSKA